MAGLKCVGILAHPRRPNTAPIAKRIAETLEARGIQTWLYTDWTEEDVREEAKCADMVVAIGGDGAMLRAARVCAPYKVPVLGVNMGRLGFLTEIREPDHWDQYIDPLINGEYWIETRMMVHTNVTRDGEVIATEDGLNDVVVSRSIVTGIVRLEMYINEDWTTTYNADALIIATPTGSTSYALAAGGPILPPELRNILIVPVAPHLSMDRSIVLSEGSTVAVVAMPDSEDEVYLIVDGRSVAHLQAGDVVRVTSSEFSSQFVRMREHNYFYRSLLDRLEPRIIRPQDGLPDEDNEEMD
ncbi:MAG: NAD(+)/NADH kinase [Anaerolineae bacterium]|nr:NAD(+)/NADH kinase [Anaerolineae bacterium]